MADFTENFNTAPNGNMRQFGVLAGALGIRASKGRSSSGGSNLSARDQANMAREAAMHQSILSEQGHKQDMEMASHTARLGVVGDVAKHVIGQEGAKADHKRTMAVNRQQNKFDTQKDFQQRLFTGSEAQAQREHTSSENAKNRRAGAAAAKNTNVRSFNPTTGAVATTHPMQEAPQAQAPRQFDSVSLHDLDK